MSQRRIIRDRLIVPDDWAELADDAAPAEAGRFIVSFKRWRGERQALEASGLAVGVRIANTEDIGQVWAELSQRPLIALEWPKFADGRAFTQARLLRTRFGYAGELRAVGDVARDQMFYMQRCGINAFVPRPDQDLDGCLAALSDFSAAYQAAGDAMVPVLLRRRQVAAPA